MPDSESAFFGDVYFEPCDSVAIFEDSGVVRTEPVLLQRSTTADDGADGGSEYFVRLDGNYFPAETVAGFIRYEKVPTARPRPAPLPRTNYTAEPGTAKVEKQNVYDRLAAARERWASNTKT